MPHVLFSGAFPPHIRAAARHDRVPGPRFLADPVPAAHGLSDARRPAPEGAGASRPLARQGSLHAPARDLGRARPLRAARWPALCQWQHPHRPCAQQDPEGHGDAQPADARLRFQLRAGLGLPRPADRMEDRGNIAPRAATRTRYRSSKSARNAAPSRRSGSTRSARNSSGWASPAIGIIPIRPWRFPPKRRSRARS